MRLAILTDIHANREAFEAVRADLALRAIDRIALLGDIVGYGPDPEWCAGQAMALVAAGAVCVKGNHDAAIADGGQGMNAVARAAIDWTRPLLSPAAAAFLAALPLVHAEGELLFVHASAHAPGDWIYVTGARAAMASFRASRARVIFCGHLHVPKLLTADLAGRVQDHRVPIGTAVPLLHTRRWLAVVGSVGQPRDGVPEAAYAIHDAAANTLTFRRVPYEAARTAAKIRAAGLPEALAQRLLDGA